MADQDRTKWKRVVEKIEILKKKEKWYGLDLSNYERRRSIGRLECKALYWTTRRYPNWNSPKLYGLLHRWAVGNRKLGKREGIEHQDVDGTSRKEIISSILHKDEVA
jgi:hypothetical protein